MTIHEQMTRAEIVRAQTELLNRTIELAASNPTTEMKDALIKEVLRLSKLIT